jgi:hypothetical protein
MIIFKVCSFCGNSNVYLQDVEKNGYKVKCKTCGRKLMLCSACLEAEDNPNRVCEYNVKAGCFRERKTEVQND